MTDSPANNPRQPWHARSCEDVLQALEASPDGLAASVAAARLHEHGPNALPAPRRTPPWRRFLHHFNDPLILFLLAAAVVAASPPSWPHWSRRHARISPASTAYSPRMQTCARS